MALPALIYLAIAGDVEPNGWGVPVATDIACSWFAGNVGTVLLFSSVIPFGLAVIDDIGAILIIALVYSTGVKVLDIGTFFMVFGFCLQENRS